MYSCLTLSCAIVESYGQWLCLAVKETVRTLGKQQHQVTSPGSCGRVPVLHMPTFLGSVQCSFTCFNLHFTCFNLHSLLVTDCECHFMWLLAICISSSVIVLFLSLLLSCRSLLNILNANPLWDTFIIGRGSLSPALNITVYIFWFCQEFKTWMLFPQAISQGCICSK